MKKALIQIMLFITFIAIYMLQVGFFSNFTIAGVKPNLIVILTLFIGLFAGQNIGTILGMIFGIYIDIVIGKTVGISGVMLGIVGFLGGYFDKNFSKESRIAIIIMVIGSTIIYEIGEYIFNILNYGVTPEINIFSRILLIETIYNVLITIIIYPIFQKVGYRIEENIKGRNILTRYF